MEVDCYVLIACRENTLVESRDFYRPIVTPFELELACVAGKEWTGEYELDFRRILPNLAEDLAEADKAVKGTADSSKNIEEEDDFSLITGKFTRKVKESVSDDTGKKVVAVQNGNTEIALLSGASYLAGRSYRGLEQKVGKTKVRKAVVGRGGIAMSYGEEGRTDDISRIVDGNGGDGGDSGDSGGQ